jgi:hypothetical protein
MRVKSHSLSRLDPQDLGERLARFFSREGAFWLLRVTDNSHSDGSCLLVAQALRDLLAGARVVTLVTAGRRNVVEHYGVLWRGWYFDGNGGFPDADSWEGFFTTDGGSPVKVVDRFIQGVGINNFSWCRKDLAALIRDELA